MPYLPRLLFLIGGVACLLYTVIAQPLAAGEKSGSPLQSRELLLLLSRSEFQDPDRTNFDYLSLEFRHLVPLTNYWPNTRALSPWTGLVGIYGAKPTADLGEWIAGGYAGVRYSFPSESNTPFYAQFNFGPQLTDAYKDRDQNVIGSFLEFRSELIFGKHWSLRQTPDRFLITELNVQHISNASLAERNVGVNNLGLAIGLSRFF